MGIRGRDFVLDCLIMTTSANILSISDRIEVHEISTFNPFPSSFLNNIAFIEGRVSAQFGTDKNHLLFTHLWCFFTCRRCHACPGPPSETFHQNPLWFVLYPVNPYDRKPILLECLVFSHLNVRREDILLFRHLLGFAFNNKLTGWYVSNVTSTMRIYVVRCLSDNEISAHFCILWAFWQC